MSHKDTGEFVLRLIEDARQFAASGSSIVNRPKPYYDSTALRTAADQFRQAAKALDQLDAAQQTVRLLQIK